jgi:hypothetical protein
MNRSHSSTVPPRRRVDPAATSSRFVLARLQAAAHASTPYYFRMREMGPWHAAEASVDSSREASDRRPD